MKNKIVSVNYHYTRLCNFKCGFCFHTQKSKEKLPLEKSAQGLQLLKDYGIKKVNFAGGEPFLYPKYLGELVKISKEKFKIEKISIITNGSLVKKKFFEDFGKYVDVFGVSLDSFVEETNKKIGRWTKATGDNVEKLFQIREWCKEYNIKFKLNTVVCNLNKDENMVENIQKLNPDRWKCFQVLMVKGENEDDSKLRDVTKFQITDDEFNKFIERHKDIKCLVPESNKTMKSSYIILDEQMRFLDKGDGEESMSESILDVGVEKALKNIKYDEEEFKKRGGDYLFEKINIFNECKNNREIKELFEF